MSGRPRARGEDERARDRLQPDGLLGAARRMAAAHRALRLGMLWAVVAVVLAGLGAVAVGAPASAVWIAAAAVLLVCLAACGLGALIERRASREIVRSVEMLLAERLARGQIEEPEYRRRLERLRAGAHDAERPGHAPVRLHSGGAGANDGTGRSARGMDEPADAPDPMTGSRAAKSVEMR